MPPEIAIIVLPFAVAFFVSMLFGPGVIALLQRRRVGQTISADGPESHRSKAGTPTMGGLIILAGILAGVVLISWMLLSNKIQTAGRPTLDGQSLIGVVLLMAAYALLGMADDYLTIHPVRGIRGIASKPKAAAQILLAVAFVMWLRTFADFEPALYVAGKPVLVGLPYWIFAVLFITGMANFVNITDGLDGLVAGLSIIACSMFAFLLLPFVGGRTDLSMVSLLAAAAGACTAFLWFNANPARVFMGDTGSLALGSLLPAIAIVTHREVALIIIGLVFILDGLSSALQWAVFKYTRIRTGTGHRVFKKSPVHHHFELSGWAEQTVVVRFWIVAIVFAVLAMAGVALRIW